MILPRACASALGEPARDARALDGDGVVTRPLERARHAPHAELHARPRWRLEHQQARVGAPGQTPAKQPRAEAGERTGSTANASTSIRTSWPGRPKRTTGSITR
jgi:hypothetical protein